MVCFSFFVGRVCFEVCFSVLISFRVFCFYEFAYRGLVFRDRRDFMLCLMRNENRFSEFLVNIFERRVKS